MKTNVNRLLLEFTSLQVQVAQLVLTQCEQARLRIVAETTVAPRPQSTTTVEFKQQTEPPASLFQMIVKRVEVGDMTTEDGTSMFDPLTGTSPRVSFAKATKRSPRPRTSLLLLVYLLVVFWTSV